MAAKSDFLHKTLTMRGTTYTIRELSLEEFDEINEKSTNKQTVFEADGTSREVDNFDGRTQQRLMVAATVTPKVKSAELGVRLYGGLWKAVQDLHFSEEPDETKKVESGPDTDEATEPGN